MNAFFFFFFVMLVWLVPVMEEVGSLSPRAVLVYFTEIDYYVQPSFTLDMSVLQPSRKTTWTLNRDSLASKN